MALSLHPSLESRLEVEETHARPFGWVIPKPLMTALGIRKTVLMTDFLPQHVKPVRPLIPGVPLIPEFKIQNLDLDTTTHCIHIQNEYYSSAGGR